MSEAITIGSRLVLLVTFRVIQTGVDTWESMLLGANVDAEAMSPGSAPGFALMWGPTPVLVSRLLWHVAAISRLVEDGAKRASRSISDNVTVEVLSREAADEAGRKWRVINDASESGSHVRGLLHAALMTPAEVLKLTDHSAARWLAAIADPARLAMLIALHVRSDNFESDCAHDYVQELDDERLQGGTRDEWVAAFGYALACLIPDGGLSLGVYTEFWSTPRLVS